MTSSFGIDAISAILPIFSATALTSNPSNISPYLLTIRVSASSNPSMEDLFSISTLDANFVKLKGSVSQESTALAKLKQDLAGIKNIKGLENQQREFERITAEVNRLSTAYKSAKAEAASVAATQQLLTGKNVLGNQIETWMNRNTKAAKIYGAQLEVG